MTNYEIWDLILTFVYDVSTICLLIFVIYEALIKPKIPDIAFYPQYMPIDTKNYSLRAQPADFIFENRGIELKNISIKSDPDYLGWGNIGKDKNIKPKKTSEIFSEPIPFFGKNEKIQFFWCELKENIDVVSKPFKIIIEFDRPIFPFFCHKQKREFKFNFSVYKEVLWGLNQKYDIHNVAEELLRIREIFEKKEVV